MYQQIIWDFDGTLFDTYPFMTNIFKKVLEEEGHIEPYQDILNLMKQSMNHVFRYYIEKYSLKDTFNEKFKRYSMEQQLTSCKPFPDVEEVCRFISNSGKFNYLFTHRGESSINFLEEYGLHDYFKDFITSQHGFEKKPSPHAILHLIEKHGMKPKEAIMIGDRDIDIISAKNAGIAACLFAPEDERCDAADYTIHSIKELYDII